jgi:uncharacterized protein
MQNFRISFFASRWGIILAGAVIGSGAALLQKWGNPPNMGLCAACFGRDIAGALGLHRAAVVQYLRPEIPGFVLGSFIAAALAGEFRSRTGSAPIARFFLGIFAMIGALVFLGCPWRSLLRLAGGDLNALIGIPGLVIGIAIGVWFLRRGYSLGRSYQGKPVGWILPVFMLGLLVMAILKSSLLIYSEKGPGAMFAPVLISTGVALLIGFIAQRTRFCTMGAVRDLILTRDTHLMVGVAALVLVAFGANLVLGQVSFGFEMQKIAHSNHIWNFLAMVLSGLAFALAGGCPGRQLFLSGEGDGDAAVFVMGMLAGAAVAHNFSLTAVPDKTIEGVLQIGGPEPNGQIAVLIGLVFCVVLGFVMREKWEDK